MAFFAQCPFCGCKMRAPDYSQGSSVPCPRCGDPFTIVPMSAPPDPAAIELVPPPAAYGPVATTIASVARQAEHDAEESTSPQSGGPSLAARPRPATPLPSLLAAGGLFLACLGATFLSFAEWRWTSVSLAAGGLVLAVASRFVMVSQRDRPTVLPLVTGGLAVTTLVIAGVFPMLLATAPPVRRSPSAPPERDMKALYVVPHKGLGLQPAPEWAQADQFTLQRGDLRVQVLGGELREEAVPGTNVPEIRLDLSLRLLHVGASPPVTLAPLANAPGRPAPMLRHDNGDAFPWSPPPPGTTVLPRDRLPAQQSVEFVLTFQGNPREEDLLLELPALDGGAGSFRFRIPPTMIRR
jgi:hypothetical protein